MKAPTSAMPDADDPPGIGHNRPPPPRFELRRSRGISCDWTHPKKGASRPLRFERYWRITRDGKIVDSFLRKANAVQMIERLRARANRDA